MTEMTQKDGGLTDEQLLEFSPEQARQQLNEDQLERYNDLKQGDLSESVENRKTEKTAANSEGLKALRESVEDQLHVTVRGIKFKADLDQRQVERLVSLSKFEDQKPEDLNDNQFSEVRKNLLSLLSDLSVDFDQQDWENEFGDAGLVTLATLTGEILDEIEEFMEQKKSR